MKGRRLSLQEAQILWVHKTHLARILAKMPEDQRASHMAELQAEVVRQGTILEAERRRYARSQGVKHGQA